MAQRAFLTHWDRQTPIRSYGSTGTNQQQFNSWTQTVHCTIPDYCGSLKSKCSFDTNGGRKKANFQDRLFGQFVNSSFGPTNCNPSLRAVLLQSIDLTHPSPGPAMESALYGSLQERLYRSASQVPDRVSNRLGWIVCRCLQAIACQEFGTSSEPHGRR